MKLYDMFKISLKIIKKQLKESPDKCFVNSKGDSIRLDDVAAEMKKVLNWLYQPMDTGDIQKVVHCSGCRFWVTQKEKEGYLTKNYKVCKLDNLKRDPDFFCKAGIEK